MKHALIYTNIVLSMLTNVKMVPFRIYQLVWYALKVAAIAWVINFEKKYLFLKFKLENFFNFIPKPNHYNVKIVSICARMEQHA